MFESFATELAARAYPAITRPVDRRLIIETMTEELRVGFGNYYLGSLNEAELQRYFELQRSGDPGLLQFVELTGWDEKWREFSSTYTQEKLELDASESLIPTGTSPVVSTVYLRDESGSETAPSAPPPWPERPTPTDAEPTPKVNINLGRRK